MQIYSNIQYIRSQIPKHVRIVAIAKGRSVEEIEEVIKAGIFEIGENRVQEACKKFPKLKAAYPHIILHMVGRLQRNKVKRAVEVFDVIQSVDSIKLAQKIAKYAQEKKKNISILVQVCISGKESQGGYKSEEELKKAIEEIRRLEKIHSPYLKLEGLMGIASLNNPREDFRRLKKMADCFMLPTISMGMSGDYNIAIEEGSTMVRIGRAIFEDKL